MIILLYLYPLMGLVHIVSAIGRYFTRVEKYPGYKERLGKYLLGVIIYFALIFIVNALIPSQSHNQFPSSVITIYFFIIPWGFAAYFWSTIYGNHGDDLEKYEHLTEKTSPEAE